MIHVILQSLTNPNNTEKAILSHSKRFLVGFAETIGRRPSMEDCMVVHGAFRYIFFLSLSTKLPFLLSFTTKPFHNV